MPRDGQNVVIRERLERLRDLAAIPGGNQWRPSKCLWGQARKDPRMQQLGIIDEGGGRGLFPSRKTRRFFGLTRSEYSLIFGTTAKCRKLAGIHQILDVDGKPETYTQKLLRFICA